MRIIPAAFALALLFGGPAVAQAPDPGRAAFRALYEELVEIDTSAATGSCTRAVNAMAARLRAGGFPESDVSIVIPEGKPDDGNLVARLPGRPGAGAVLLLAHIDVVNANRADWERDPFTLVEENGFFYARGASDDKAMAAVFTDLMIRLKREGFRPRKTLKLALTCGEETSNRVNGVDYLLKNRRDLIQADFAINEGAGGELTPDGAPRALHVQAGEKIHQVMTLTVTNPGGHSSRPVPENAIYRLSAAIGRVAQYQFPVELTPVTRAFFARMATLETDAPNAAAMRALSANPQDAQAAATLARNPNYNAIMRTTCVVTQVQAGHAANALPQRAVATLSCRVLQGHTADEIKAALEQAVADPQVEVGIANERAGSKAPELTRAIMGPIEAAAQRLWPGAPIIPTMTPGATDGRFLNAAGIPTYGASGMLSVPGENNAHGLNEKIRVKSLYEGREFLESIVRAYARQP